MKDQITIIEKEVTPILSEAQTLQIVDQPTLTEATRYLSQANTLLDSLTEDKERITKPINQSLKEIRAKYKPMENALEGLIASLRTKMTEYQTKADTARKQQEQAIAGRVAPGSGHYKLETAAKKIDELRPVDRDIITDTGSVQFREVKKFEVTDLSVLPLEYHLADETKIRAAMKLGQELPGVRYYSEQVPYNSR